MQWQRLVGLILCLSWMSMVRADASTAITGIVKSADAHPLAGAKVWVVRSQAHEEDRVVGRGTTSGDGRFSITINPSEKKGEPPRLSVIAACEGHGMRGAGSEVTSSKPLEITLAPETTLRAQFLLADGKPAVGVKFAPMFLTDTSGVPLGAYVSIPADLRPELAGTTDREGFVELKGLPQNTRVRFDPQDERFAKLKYQESIVLSRSAQSTGGPITLLSAATISGKVLHATGAPVADVYVSAQAVDSSDGVGDSTRTAQDGSYVLKGIRPGSYNVAIALPDELAKDWTALAYEKLAAGEGETIREKHFRLIKGSLIRGKVLEEGTRTPLPEQHVGVYGPAHPRSGAWVQNTRTAADGTFELRVPPGAQYVYYQSATPAGYLQPKVKSHDIELADGATVEVEFLLPKDPNLPVSGRVLDPAGNAVEGAFVSFDYPRDHADSYFGGRAGVRSDAQGRFTLQAVPSGSSLRATKDKQGTLKPVEIKGGEKDVILRLEDGYYTSITGTVTDTAGTPIPNARVSLTHMRGQFGIGSEPKPTDAQGRYTFENLAMDGRYSVHAGAKGYGDEQVGVPLKPGASNEAPTIKLPRADSFVAGRVLNPEGSPVAGVKVFKQGGMGAPESSVTDAAGNFRFDSIVAGSQVHIYVCRDNDKFISAQAKAGTTDTVLKLPRPVSMTPEEFDRTVP